MQMRSRHKRDVFRNVSPCGHEHFLDAVQTMAATGLSWAEIESRMKAGTFPKPSSPPGTPPQEMFHVEDVADWVATQK